MARKSVKPVLVSEVLSKVLKDRGMGGSSDTARLQARWRDAVGVGVASHAQPDTLRAGRLTVVVDSSAWMNQLSLLSPTIIKQVNSALGTDAVEEMRFRLGRVEAAGGKKAAPQAPRKRAVKPEEMVAAEEAVSPIKDDALRERVKRLLLTSCTRKGK